MKHQLKFKIADIIYKIQSASPQITKDDWDFFPRYGAFIYAGNKKPDITISVDIVDKYPAVKGKEVFSVHEEASGDERWRLWQNKSGYTYKTLVTERAFTAFINKDFSRIKAYFLPYKNQRGWDVSDLIYDMMQIVLINYFAYRKNGLILHAAGIKDGGRALVFAGKSESGKSTTAKLWHKHTKAKILNDDRVIIRKTKQGFFAYSGPWHGEFGHNHRAIADQAPLKGLFILEHAKKNFAQPLSGKEVFHHLYPILFPVVWDKDLMNNTITLCEELMEKVPIAQLGFIKNKTVIAFVRKTIDEANKL